MHTTDLDLTMKQVGELTSADAVTSFLDRLGYQTKPRTPLTPESIGLSGEAAATFKKIELLSEDDEGFLQVVFAQPRSLTAKARTDLVRVLGKSNQDHLLVLAPPDFETLEFVLLDKKKQEKRGPAGKERVQVVPVPKTISVARRSPSRLELRTLRRLTWTCRDALDQFDKLRSVFDAAAYTGEYFQNRGLFADYYLRDRLREDAAWRDNPSETFVFVRGLLEGAPARWFGKDKEALRAELYRPLLERLRFKPRPNRPSRTDQTQPDYLLEDGAGKTLSAAFVYPWDRWLDGPDQNDPDTPEENPGACVVTALDAGTADWIVVTNGRLWRLYSRQAHARATNFYEVDLVEALTASGDTDPNEAFRYFWLFFRADAFRSLRDGQHPSPPAPLPEAERGEKKEMALSSSPSPLRGGGRGEGCWLDAVLSGSREFARQLGDRLKERVFETIFPHLARGFLADRRQRLGITREPTEEELADLFEATLTFLYRLLFLLYAESRDLLPVREAPYQAASLKRIKEQVADRAGIAESDVPARVEKAYSAKDTTLYDRLTLLFRAMDDGDPSLNVPRYSGGLFILSPGDSAEREQRIARFLLEHKVPDRFLALAIDRLARDQDEKTLALVYVDYKSLEVRHLGSIYEGLLEFKLKVAGEDLTTQADRKGEKYIPLAQARPKRGGRGEPAVLVRKGDVYLSNDKAERKASGSYYTPDPIVEYIVAHTVGPVLDEKLEALRPEFRQARKTFDNELKKSQAYPSTEVRKGDMDQRQWAALQTYNHHRELVERFFDLKVLDPAMGSGHFLVEAVDFVTDRLLKFLNGFPINPVNLALERTRSSILDSLGKQGVTVDPSQLHDINLLKRHVLKRCIYGVDLNPMAVELAKVSLWLDCFTLGAPLNFLDHHLRCGNSLVGATFAELEREASSLFGIDYGPLLRAIQDVLFVSKLADATATEVSESARQYARARQALSGYQVLFDCLTARHFGLPRAAEAIVGKGMEFGLESREQFLKSLTEKKDRQLVAEVEAQARQPDRRFFHWDIEFPEVFFGFADRDERQIKPREKIAPGSAGFDVIIGNPPYVRQETIKAFKSFFKATYATYDSTNDLYVYFQELEVRNLRVGGRMGMIVANKWMRAGYGEQLRHFLQRTGQPLEVIDFGHSPIFPDADTFPCILLMSKRRQPLTERDKLPEAETMAACDVPREHWHDGLDLAAFAATRRHQIPTRLLRKQGWSLEDPRIQALLEKIRTTGTPLKDYAGVRPLRGILTGLNEAFIIDRATRDRLVGESKSSAEVIRPLLRGRHMDRWRNRPSDDFLITIPSSENKVWAWSDAGSGAEELFCKAYPAIYRHFLPLKQAMIDRQDQGRYWWELRACDYMGQFDKPKIMWQEIQFHSWYCGDENRCIVNNKVFFLPSDDLWVLGVLNSSLQWWHLTRVLPHMKDEALSPAIFLMENLHVPAGTAAQMQSLQGPVKLFLELSGQNHALEVELADDAAGRFSTPADDATLASYLPRTAEAFTTRVLKLAGVKQPAAKVAEEVAAFHRQYRTRQIELLSRQLELERKLAMLVEDAYGLTPEERALLRSTRPVRDPLDVLESRIRGSADEGETR